MKERQQASSFTSVGWMVGLFSSFGLSPSYQLGGAEVLDILPPIIAPRGCASRLDHYLPPHPNPPEAEVFQDFPLLLVLQVPLLSSPLDGGLNSRAPKGPYGRAPKGP